MKYTLLPVLAIMLFLQARSQQMTVKSPNFKSFNQDSKKVSKLLLQKSSASAKQHPEFGILPYNAQCTNCVELIDERTIDSRLFIEPENPRHTYSQKSYFPLHYKTSVDDVWHTIDKRLRPDANNAGVYKAVNQPVPTKLDVNRKTTSLIIDGFEFEFNKNLTMYFFDENSAYTKAEQGDYTTYSIGEEGLKVKNIWPGIDMQQVFSQGRIETNYVICKPLNIPINTGWMVIEDHFTLPAGYTCVENTNNYSLDGYYTGDYEIKNAAGQTVVLWKKPIYIDAKSFGMHGYYKLLNQGNDYTLQTLVPVSWLKSKDNEYPIYIDPNVEGLAQYGAYQSSGSQGDDFGYTSQSLGSCDYKLTVSLSRRAAPKKSYVELEYQLTYDNTCGSPPEAAPYCTFSQVSEQVICDDCNTSSGILTCNPATPPFSGICTTDSSLVPTARAICITNFVPAFVACITPACDSFTRLHFTLKNQDSICGDVCGYLCARGNLWRMTVEGEIDSSVLENGDTLFSPYATGNQWYRNDTAMDGDTASTLIVTRAGFYFNSAETAYGCSPDTIHFTTPGALCAAYFVILPVPIDTGSYYGYNYSSGENLSYLWNFGDGDTSTLPYPSHTYDSAGYYNLCLTVSNDSCTNTYCDSNFYAYKQAGPPMRQLNILNPTGIAQVRPSPAVSIFPNPANNKLSIHTSNLHATSIVIYDMDGRKVWQQKFVAEIDIRSLTPGIYTLEIIGAEGTIKKRLEKM